MIFLSLLSHNHSLNTRIPLNILLTSGIFESSMFLKYRGIKPAEQSQFLNLNNNHVFNPIPTVKEIRSPLDYNKIILPDYTKDLFYRNPLGNQIIINPVLNEVISYVDGITNKQYLFNKLRNDTKHRKRAFPKRGYFRRTRCMNRKVNRLSYAYALQGIDYEMLENLAMGEIPDLKDYMK